MATSVATNYSISWRNSTQLMSLQDWIKQQQGVSLKK